MFNKIPFSRITILALTILFSSCNNENNNKEEINNDVNTTQLSDNWSIISSEKINNDGSNISSPSFKIHKSGFFA